MRRNECEVMRIATPAIIISCLPASGMLEFMQPILLVLMPEHVVRDELDVSLCGHMTMHSSN